ncbi:hypothetical protein Y695_00222 [Hydrogenophaga sp. T4]|nr:hypothetical protein Y695_00222 [Hydrogenophaga sp. T4]
MPGFRLESLMIKQTVALKEPLAPHVLKEAGVPLEDALWFSRLPLAAKVKALEVTVRGRNMLVAVRRFYQANSTQVSAPMAA